MNPEITSDLGGRTAGLQHHLHRLSLELRAEPATTFWHGPHPLEIKRTCPRSLVHATPPAPPPGAGRSRTATPAVRADRHPQDPTTRPRRRPPPLISARRMTCAGVSGTHSQQAGPQSNPRWRTLGTAARDVGRDPTRDIRGQVCKTCMCWPSASTPNAEHHCCSWPSRQAKVEPYRCRSASPKPLRYNSRCAG